IERRESRGGHFRDDHPDKDPAFATFNVVVRKQADGTMAVSRVPIPEMPEELKGVGAEMKKSGEGRMGGQTATFRIWRGEAGEGTLRDYQTTISEGMVVLDAMHQIQAEQANDMAVRWNCKAGKCGSCSAEVNGHPRLMCMTRLNQLDLSKPV